MEQFYICLEMGGTNLRVGIVNEAFQVLYFKKTPTLALAQAEDKIDFFATLLQPLVQRACLLGHPRAVCLSLASLMDRNRKVVYSSPMVVGFDNLALADGLEQRLQMPVVMEKDVNALLMYEVNQNQLPQEGIVMGVFLGTGLGNAICIDGRVYPGYSGAACELGHIAIPGLEAECGCGKKGCIELKACGRRLQEIAGVLQCPVEELFIQYAQHPLVQEQVNYFAIAIAIEATLLDPASILLGGGVIDMKGFPLEELQNRVLENVRKPYPCQTLTFAKASGNSKAGVVGIAMHAALVLKETEWD